MRRRRLRRHERPKPSRFNRPAPDRAWDGVRRRDDEIKCYAYMLDSEVVRFVRARTIISHSPMFARRRRP